MNALIDKAIKAIVRPPRRSYDPSELPLFLDAEDGHMYIRHPLNFTNSRQQKIVGSIFVDARFDIMNGGPCVIYLHGNASSQAEGQFLVPSLCKLGIAVYCFDFAGCGASEGEYISLGYFEKEDTELLMHYLNISFKLGPFVLWGRSMGAATALIAKSPLLVGRVVDSSYTSIYDVCCAIAGSLKVPHFVLPGVIWILRNNISSTVHFDLYTVSPLNSIKEPTSIPLLLGHAREDEFIPYDQAEQIISAYNCDQKELITLEGGHNSRRNLAWIKEGCLLCLRAFGKDTNGFEASKFKGFQSSSHHFRNYEELLEFASKSDVIKAGADLSREDSPAGSGQADKDPSHSRSRIKSGSESDNSND